MWLDSEIIMEYLISDDPEKVRTGLLYLGEPPETVINFCLAEAQLPHFGTNVLEAVSRSEGGLSEDVQMAFLNLVWQCYSV